MGTDEIKELTEAGVNPNVAVICLAAIVIVFILASFTDFFNRRK